MSATRVLLVLLAGHGGRPAPAALASAAGVRGGRHAVDVVVLDDGRADEVSAKAVESACRSLDFGYYRSPRSLGVARSMNLGLAWARREGHDHAILTRPDVVLPTNLVDAMVRVADGTAGAGSVSAWSDGPSVVCLPSLGGSDGPGWPDDLDWISGRLADEFGASALDIPAGDGSCILVPVRVAVAVGQFDPVYASGHFETVDWCLRSRERGYRTLLAPSALVRRQHLSADDRAAASDRLAVTTADEERIVDLRYPWRRADMAAFAGSGAVDALAERAIRSIVSGGVARSGYDVEATWVPGPAPADRVRIVVDPDGRSSTAAIEFGGFRLVLDVPGGDLPAMLVDMTGAAPSHITVHDRGLFTDQLAAEWEGAVPFEDRRRYPQRV